MTDIQAALVNVQFDDFESSIDYRHELANIYLNEIINEQVILPVIPDNKIHTWQTFHLILKSEEKRDAMRIFLSERGIMTNYGAQCIPHMTYYIEKYGHNSKAEFPNAYKAFSSGLAIPLFDLLTKIEVNYISESINKFN